MKKQLQIRINPNGTIDARTLGIKGQKCTEYKEILEQILESRTISYEYTDEYYQSEVNALVDSQVQQALA